MPPPAARDEFRVTLLGIGGPAPNMRRFGPGVLVRAAHHTKPDEAGVVFSRVKPRLAVFYHFVLLGMPGTPPVNEKDVFEQARQTYNGPLLIGEDLMAFRLDAGSVVQIAPRAP